MLLIGGGAGGGVDGGGRGGGLSCCQRHSHNTHTQAQESIQYSTVWREPGGPDGGGARRVAVVVVVVVVVDTVTPGCFLQSETDPSRHRTKHLLYIQSAGGVGSVMDDWADWADWADWSTLTGHYSYYFSDGAAL